MRPLYYILLVIGLEWLRSSYGKLAGGKFPQELAGTLSKVTPKNPYPFYKDFLNSVAIPNGQLFGTLVMWGEFLTAVAITLGTLLLLFAKLSKQTKQLVTLMLAAGLAGGVFLNTTFWLGFGYTSPSTDGLNLLMAIIQAIGFIYVIRTRNA